MRLTALLPLIALATLSSCETTTNDYLPEYLKPDSPLDPPGTAAARAAMRAKVLKEGKFTKDDTPSVNDGKAFFFDRNPDRDEDANGRMVKTEHVKVIACEGLYYFVQADDGQRGYVRESDFLAPVQLVSTLDTPLGDGSIFPELPQEDGPVELEGNQTLMTNRNGRTVIVKDKKTEKSDEFEQRKNALLNKESMPESDFDVPDLPEPTDLPEPSGSNAQ